MKWKSGIARNVIPAGTLAAALCVPAALESVFAQPVQPAQPLAAELAALKAELEAVRRALPGHAHVMAELDYHFSNLWFAAQEGHWALAEFYLNETRSNLNWMIRIRPTRRLPSGQDLDLTPVVRAVEEGVLSELRTAIANKERGEFETAYYATMEQCYACHKMAEKPFLRPAIPQAPASRMINMQPDAQWPK